MYSDLPGEVMVPPQWAFCDHFEGTYGDGYARFAAEGDIDLKRLARPTMALKNVFTFDVTVVGFVLASLSNLATGALCAWLTARLFHSEKIMFNA